MGKVAYLVFGAESSCTRFVTNCLIEAGCSGETWNDNHEQKIDFEEPTDDLVVWRRSYPHKWDNTDYPYIIKDSLPGSKYLIISQDPKSDDAIELKRSTNRDEGMEF